MSNCCPDGCIPVTITDELGREKVLCVSEEELQQNRRLREIVEHVLQMPIDQLFRREGAHQEPASTPAEDAQNPKHSSVNLKISVHRPASKEDSSIR